MRIITLNVNGLRSAVRKGLWQWVADTDPDILCLQETKVHCASLTPDFFPESYSVVWHDAVKPGYSGVAILSKTPAQHVQRGLGFPLADTEGRYVQIDLGRLSIASLYLPSGSSGEVRQTCKFDFMAQYERLLGQLALSDRYVILCGDWNIVHRQIDIKNWTSNQKNSGCLPEERAWLDKLLNTGWHDAFRIINQEAEQYTWWSNRGQAWLKNVGWRIDYQIISNNLKSLVKSVHIEKAQRFSDHAPLIIDYADEITSLSKE